MLQPKSNEETVQEVFEQIKLYPTLKNEIDRLRMVGGINFFEYLNNILAQKDAELQKARDKYENILRPLLDTMSDPRAGSTWNELAKKIYSELDQDTV